MLGGDAARGDGGGWELMDGMEVWGGMPMDGWGDGSVVRSRRDSEEGQESWGG